MRNILICLSLAVFLISGAASAEAEGSRRYTLMAGGKERSYLLYTPAGWVAGTRIPLVIMLHGGFGTGAQAEKSYGWDAQAAKEGFIVAYPDGIGRSWNAGGICCGRAAKDSIDDVGFIDALISDLVSRYSIDPSWIYLTGISNGAAMSYRYVCEGRFPVAAIGAVAGSYAFSCKPHVVSVMEIHGLDDHNIPMAGGIGPKGVSKVNWMPVSGVMGIFSRADHCGNPVRHDQGKVHVETAYCDEGREVMLVTIEGAGHQWPGAKPVAAVARLLLSLDSPSREIDATPELWRFFARHQVR